MAKKKVLGVLSGSFKAYTRYLENIFKTYSRYSGVVVEEQKKKKSLRLLFEKSLGNPALNITANLKILLDIRTLW